MGSLPLARSHLLRGAAQTPRRTWPRKAGHSQREGGDYLEGGGLSWPFNNGLEGGRYLLGAAIGLPATKSLSYPLPCFKGLGIFSPGLLATHFVAPSRRAWCRS